MFRLCFWVLEKYHYKVRFSVVLVSGNYLGFKRVWLGEDCFGSADRVLFPSFSVPLYAHNRRGFPGNFILNYTYAQSLY